MSEVIKHSCSNFEAQAAMSEPPVLVVLYLPDDESIQRLRLLCQDISLYIFDNSPNDGLPDFSSHCVYRKSSVNVGISGAMKWMVEQCFEKGFSQFLFFDQDTRFDLDTLVNIRKGLLTSQRKAPVVHFTSDKRLHAARGQTQLAKFVINSGSVFDVESLRSLEDRVLRRFFVDAVDLAICLHLREQGLLVLRQYVAGIDHEAEQGFKTLGFSHFRFKVKGYPFWRRAEFYSAHRRLLGDCVRLFRFIDAAIILKFMCGFATGQFRHDVLSRFLVRVDRL